MAAQESAETKATNLRKKLDKADIDVGSLREVLG